MVKCFAAAHHTNSVPLHRPYCALLLASAASPSPLKTTGLSLLPGCATANLAKIFDVAAAMESHRWIAGRLAHRQQLRLLVRGFCCLPRPGSLHHRLHHSLAPHRPNRLLREPRCCLLGATTAFSAALTRIICRRRSSSPFLCSSDAPV